MYQVVRDHFETFRAQAAGLRDGEGLPRFVEQEFREFPRCGCLAGGFARFRCNDCGVDRLVPFSCKARACCPSCGPSTRLRAVPSDVEGRRAADGGTRRAPSGPRLPAGAGAAVGADAAASAAVPARVGPRPVPRGRRCLRPDGPRLPPAGGPRGQGGGRTRWGCGRRAAFRRRDESECPRPCARDRWRVCERRRGRALLARPRSARPRRGRGARDHRAARQAPARTAGDGRARRGCGRPGWRSGGHAGTGRPRGGVRARHLCAGCPGGPARPAMRRGA